MTTFKQFLSEGFHADQKAKLLAVKLNIATALKVPRHRIISWQQITDSDRGKKWMLAYKLPEGQQDDFYLRMFEKLVKRELDKVFDKWKPLDAMIDQLDEVPTAMVRFYLPDADGLLP